MSDTASEPASYRVSYTGRVFDQLRTLADVARERGDWPEFADALRELHRRLQLYPQFGEQLNDLTTEPGQIWSGIIRPLSIKYTVYDARRLVLVSALPVLLPKSKSQRDDA